MFWTLGAPEMDARLGPGGLDAAGVHEVKPASAGAGAESAALAFLLRLAGRRLAQLSAANPGRTARLLWCASSNAAHEAGRLYGPGLRHLGLDPAALIIVETRRESEALWAIEEGLKSASLALVVGQFGAVDLTPARRLSLAAETHRTPCLLLTAARTPAAAATATRWRIGPSSSAPNPFDARAPGAPRYAVALERCRNRLADTEASPVFLEWSDETHRFRRPAAVADRTAQAEHARRRAG